MKSELVLIPTVSIHPGQINMYHEVNWHPHKPVKSNYDTESPEHGRKYKHLLESSRTAEGRVSPIAKRKMLKALKYMLLMANQKTVHNVYSGKMFKFRIAFVTLTLPSTQIHSDNEIKSNLLNQFLIEIRKKYHVKNYIWRAEKQKNGNLHFHILVDKFIPYQELRDKWNRIVNKLGYVDRYRQEQIDWHKNGFRVRKELLKTWPEKKQFEAYKRNKSIHWNSPNSTDIHSVQKVHNVKQYIAKYLTKDEIRDISQSNQNIDIMIQKGRIWGCNQELSNIKGAQAPVDNQLSDEIQELVNSEGVKVIKDTYFQIAFFDMELIMRKPNSQLFKLFSQFLIDKFDYNLQTEIAA